MPNGQRATPRHSRAETLTCDQDRSGTPGVSSSRSPVSVDDAHAVNRCTSRPSAVAATGSNSSSCGASSGVLPRRRAVVNLVQAQIVSSTLQQCERGPARQAVGQRVGQPGQVAVDELALQRDGRGGHHAPGYRRRPPARSPAPGRPATCRCRCRPAPPDARRSANACATASAICTWPGRSVPPSAATAVVQQFGHRRHFVVMRSPTTRHLAGRDRRLAAATAPGPPTAGCAGRWPPTLARRRQIGCGRRAARRAPAARSAAATARSTSGGSDDRVDDLLDDRAGRPGQPQRCLAAAVRFLVAAALLHRQAVDLDELVDHAGGRRARAGDHRGARRRRCRRVRRAAPRSRTRRDRRTPRSGCPVAPELVELGAHLAGQHAEIAGVDAHRAEFGAGDGDRRWPPRSSCRRCRPAASSPTPSASTCARNAARLVRVRLAVVCSSVNACALVPSAGMP